MKKILLSTSLILLLAAACNKAKAPEASVQQNTSVSTNINQQSSNHQETADATVKWKTYVNSDLGYSIQYPATWVVTDESKVKGSTTRDVIINPSDTDPYAASYPRYIHIRIESGTSLDFVKNIAAHDPGSVVQKIRFANEDAYEHTYSFDQGKFNFRGIYVLHGGKVFDIYTQYNNEAVQKAFATFSFTK